MTFRPRDVGVHDFPRDFPEMWVSTNSACARIPRPTSCSDWWAEQFRLLLASLAYTLMQTISAVALVGTELARAQCTTIGLKLFKVADAIVLSVRRIRFLLPSSYPYRELFELAALRLRPNG